MSASRSRLVDTRTLSSVFPGDSEMAQRCRGFDWSRTALGPVGDWSQSLRTTAGIVLTSRNPMFLWWGPELVQIYNDAYRPSFGETGRHPTALGERGRECWTDIWDAIGPQIEQVMLHGTATWHEDQYLPIFRNGTMEDVWWTYSYSPVYDDDGSIGGTLVVCMETTRRVLSAREERRLLDELSTAVAHAQGSEQRYRRLFESIDDGFCVIEVLFEADRAVDYRFIEANPAMLRHTGLTDVIGRSARELVPDLEPLWVERYGEVARTGAAQRFDAESESMQRWFDVYAFRIGAPSEGRVALTFKDVTSEKTAQRERERLLTELGLERSRLVTAFQLAPTFLAILRGPEHVFEFVNEAYYGVVGHRDMVGLSVREALPEVIEQGFADLLDNVFRTGEPFVGREIPVRLQRSQNAEPEVRYIDFIYQPITEADGTHSGITAHGSDVTEQVLARASAARLLQESEAARLEAEEARAEAEMANRSKSEFLAIMSHELRTPLNAIGGYAELMELGIRGPVTPLQIEDLRRIQASQRHLLGLINEVLNYAKIETGTVQYDLEGLRLRDSVGAAESLVSPQARSKGLALKVETCPDDAVALADSEKLRQVLVNLLSNAIKFTDRGGSITVTCASTETEAIVQVEDTGIGIPEDKLGQIFDPFVQVRTDLNRPHEGTGLGLAISRDLARGMCGDLTVTSTLGEGSVFTLRLPRVV